MRAEWYGAAIKIEQQSDIPKAIATLWRCALLTQRVLG